MKAGVPPLWTARPDACGKALFLSTKFRHWRQFYVLLNIELFLDAVDVVL